MPEIAKYKVGVSRAARGGPVRWMTLKLAAPEGDLGQVSLFFHEGAQPPLGFINRGSGFVVANLPLADFDAAYNLVNIEQPVFVTWRVDASGERLISLDLCTAEEPPGEGPIDLSP
jgi:hypothetical protein